MPIVKVGKKTVTANTFTQCTELPSAPGTVVLSSGGTMFLSPTNSANDAYVYIGSIRPTMIFLSNMNSLWVSNSTGELWLSYYPAAETPVPM